MNARSLKKQLRFYIYIVEKDYIATGITTPAAFQLLNVPQKQGSGGGVAVIFKTNLKFKLTGYRGTQHL